jgi:transglutaminase-like putative cysteine protease
MLGLLPGAGAIPATLEGIPSGAAGIRATLKRMAALARHDKVQPAINQLAVEITEGVPEKYWPGYARAIQAWVQNNIRYVLDPVDVEAIRYPLTTLQLGAGDCDDQSMLVAALLESIGLRARFKAVAFQTDQFGNPEYEHVYPQVMIPNGNGPQWYALETTEPYSFGQEPAGIIGAMVQNVS